MTGHFEDGSGGAVPPVQGGSFLIPVLTLSMSVTAVAAVAQGRTLAKAGHM